MFTRVICLLAVLAMNMLPANSQCTTRYCYGEDDSEVLMSDKLLRLNHQLKVHEETIHSLQDQIARYGNKLNKSTENVWNKCQTNNGGCTQLCIDAYDSYYCSCHNGHRLENKTIASTCKDIDECSNHNGGCEQSCVNTEGSFYCGCRNGFKLSRNLRSCEDVNECEEHVCGNDKCINTYGGYFCGSPTVAGPGTQDCAYLLKQGLDTSGVYYIFVREVKKFIPVYCDMDTDGGGWLVFQRRHNGSIRFNRDWDSYKTGFGNVSREFWLGNEYLHYITLSKQYTLRIDMKDFENETRYATYSTFEVASESLKYQLTVGGYVGDAGDAMKDSDDMHFSTEDRDNDECTCHCSQSAKGGWWYNSCALANLNGLYPEEGRTDSFRTAITWVPWHGWYYSLKDVEMKLRP